VHVRDDISPASVRIQASQSVPEIAAVLRPAAGRERLTPDIQADRDPLGVSRYRRSHPFWRLKGGRSEVHPRGSGGQGRGERTLVADAPRQLYRNPDSSHDLGEQFPVVAAAERGVEVDQVDPFGSVSRPRECRLQRIAV
jgi:hypothetical protein